MVDTEFEKWFEEGPADEGWAAVRGFPGNETVVTIRERMVKGPELVVRYKRERIWHAAGAEESVWPPKSRSGRKC